MAQHKNECLFIGELVTEPQVEYSAAGNAYARLRVKVTEEYKDTQHSTTINFTLFGELAEALDKLQKGDTVKAEGRFSNSKYTNKDGVDVWQVSIIASRFEKA